MASRDDIIAAIRASLPKGAFPLPVLPYFDEGSHPPLDEWFAGSLARMGGTVLDRGTPADPLEPARRFMARFDVVCSLVEQLPGNFDIGKVYLPRDLAGVDLAVVGAAFGVAETGSVAFTEAELEINALVYLAQHLLVVLDPGTIVPNLHHAYRMAQFHQARYTVFHTGPSATADIEGVLIHGAQGVRSLSVLLAGSPAAPPAF